MKREVFIGDVGIGGTHPVSIQSMTSTDTRDVETTLKQIRALATAGCQIVRLAIPAQDAVSPFGEIIKQSPLPVVADIHFDARLALQSMEKGAHAIRINPGNIGSKQKVKDILKAAAQNDIPIRIGVNGGSLEKKFRDTPGTLADKMAASVLDKVRFFEDQDFFDIKISLKASDVNETVKAYRLMDKMCDYPLHLGVTEAGTFFSGTVKSAIGIGALLLEGIGNTIRVSLTDDPVQEIKVAKEILKVTGLRREGIEIISCPTCSRTTVDLIAKAKEAEAELSRLDIKKKIVVAIMGCEVNGPGEAKHADIGLAFSHNHGYIFQQGKLIQKVLPEESIPKFLELIKSQNSTS